MQEGTIAGAQKAYQQLPLTDETTEAKRVPVEQLLGKLRLNLTQPECSDGRGNS